MGQIDPSYVQQCLGRAERGDPDALCNLGRMYCSGHGVELNLVEAHKWFNLAAARGNVQAKLYREEIAHEMSPSDVAAAQREARQWMTEH